MKIWQMIGVPVCAGIWLFIAAANLDAMSALAGDEVLFDQYGVIIKAWHAYAVVSISADALLAISSVALFWQAGQRRWMRASLAVIAWAICAAISWHSMWLWLGKNQHGNVIASTQSLDVYEATKSQLDDAQKRYSWLAQTNTSKMGPKTLREHRESLMAAERRLDELRKQLGTADIKIAAKPIPYFDIIGATLLLILNTICWPAIFGPRHSDVRGGTPAVPVGTPLVGIPGTALMAHPGTLDDNVKGTAPGAPDGYTPGTPPEINGLPPVPVGGTPPPVPVGTSDGTEPGTPAAAQKKTDPGTPPDDTPKPPGNRNKPGGPNVTNLVTLQEGSERAVRLWKSRHTIEDANGFLPLSDAWESYQQNGTAEIAKDEFGRLLKAHMSTDRKSRKVGGKSVWGYPGVSIRAIEKRATATT